jgi:hypothetical protein
MLSICSSFVDRFSETFSPALQQGDLLPGNPEVVLLVLVYVNKQSGLNRR